MHVVAMGRKGAGLDADEVRIGEAIEEMGRRVMRTVRAPVRWREEISQAVLLKMWACLTKFDPTRSTNLEAYLYRVGQRAAWRSARGLMRGDLPALPALDGGDSDVGIKRVADCRPVEDVVFDEQRHTSEVRHTLKLLDRVLRKSKDQLRTEPLNKFNQGVIAGLQEFRRSLVGTYRPMDLEHVHYSRDRMTNKGGDEDERG